jgi:hypothetical protein
LKDTNSAGPADLTFDYGPGGKGRTPLVGNWTYSPSESPAAVRTTTATSAAVNADAMALTSAALAPIVQQAIASWAAAGASAAALVQMANTPVVLGHLPGGQLAQQVGGQIIVDSTAAGLSGLLDSTPSDVQETFGVTTAVPSGSLDPEAVDRVDLLAAVEQQLGQAAALNALLPPA